MNATQFSRPGKLGDIGRGLLTVLFLVVVGIVIWRLYVGGYIPGHKPGPVPSAQQPTPESTAPVAVASVTPTPPPPRPPPAPVVAQPVVAPTQPAELFRWRPLGQSASVWVKELPAESFRIQDTGRRSWLLKNLMSGVAKVVMEGLDIRKGPIEYDIRLTKPGTCQLGLSPAPEVDDYKTFSLSNFPSWAHIRMEMQAGKAAITVNKQKAAFQYGNEGISYVQPFIMVMPGQMIEVSRVLQTQTQ